MKVQKFYNIVKQVSRGHAFIGILLAILSNILVQLMIPGSSIIEALLACTVSILTLITVMKENQTKRSVLETIEKKYQDII